MLDDDDDYDYCGAEDGYEAVGDDGGGVDADDIESFYN